MANDKITNVKHLTLSAMRCAAMVDSKISELADAISQDLNELPQAVIFDVLELPTEDIDDSVFYRIPKGTFVANQGVSNGNCYIVEELPSFGEPVTADGQSVNAGYYNTLDNNVYGYLPDALASAVGVPAGWYPFTTLAPVFNVTWIGVVGNILDCPEGNNLGLLLDGDLWHYKHGWKSVSPIGWRGEGAMAEVFNHPSNIASGIYSHAEGRGTTASDDAAHAEGFETSATGACSHAEGQHTVASGIHAHAEGRDTSASGECSHAEGESTIASGWASHAEGVSTTASGTHSHAEGRRTIAAGFDQHVQGRFNVEDASAKYAHIVGNGTNGVRSNAHTVDWNGNAWFSGNLKIGGTGQDDEVAKTLATEEYVDNAINTATSDDVIDLLTETGIITPAYAGNNIFYTDNNGVIYTI